MPGASAPRAPARVRSPPTWARNWPGCAKLPDNPAPGRSAHRAGRLDWALLDRAVRDRAQMDRALRSRAMPSWIETGWELGRRANLAPARLIGLSVAPVSLADVKSASVRST